MKVVRLETIAAIRDTATRYETNARKARDGGYAMAADAAVFEEISGELEDLANEIATHRAFALTRWITGIQSRLSLAKIESLIGMIAAAPATLECRSARFGEGDATQQYHIRLVNYYDSSLEEWRWAVEYNGDTGTPGVSDNAIREDAEFRYWAVAKMMGQVQQ